MSRAARMSMAPLRVSNAHNIPRSSTGQARKSTGHPPQRRSSVNVNDRPTTRKSLAPQASSRRSSTYGAERHTDARPISDSEYKEQTIQIIIKYLITHGYPSAVSPKLLRQPNNKDFFLIVSFLYRQIDESFRMSAKAEEDVVMIFKHLRYPHAINKSYLKSVGSPYTWPAILAALGWLVQTLMYQEEVEVKDADETDSTLHGYDDSKLFFKYLSGAYGSFLAGEDNFDHWDAQLEKSFSGRNGAIKSEIEKLEKNAEDLKREIERLTNEKEELPALKKQRAVLEGDVRKFEGYIDQVEEYSTKIRAKKADRQQEIDEIEELLEQVAEESEAIAKILEEQQEKCVDIDELTSEKTELNHQLETQGQRLQVARRELDATEMKLERQTKSLEEKLEVFMSTGRQLKLLPISAKNANGIDFNLNPLLLDSKCGSSETLHKVVGHLKDVVEPALHNLREKYSGKFKAFQRQQMELQKEVHLKEEAIQVERYAVESLRTKLNKVTRGVELENENLEENRRQTTEETEAMQHEMQTAAHEIKIDYERSLRRLSELQASLDTQRSAIARENEKLNEVLINALDQLFAHKTYIQETLQKMHEHLAQQKQELM